MSELDPDEILCILDEWRRAGGVPSALGGLVHEFSPDRAESRIVYSALISGDVDDVIRAEIAAAEAGGYELEWKVYSHDTPADLPEQLQAAGFVAEDVESVLVLPLTETTVGAFDRQDYEIRRVRDAAGLEDVAEVAREMGRLNADPEKQRYTLTLRDAPETVSIHVVYIDGEPVASGRVHYAAGGLIAEIAGSRTKTTHRRRGIFTALLVEQLREALETGRRYVFTDALPLSEPIFRKHGFTHVTRTKPFLYALRSKS